MKEKQDGFSKVLSLFPVSKRKGEMDALVVWDNLSQDEKKQVIRHCSVYVKNTNQHFIKQVGNYFNERLWEQLTPEHSRKDNPMYNKKELLDGNFLSFIMKNYDEVNSIEETVKMLSTVPKEIVLELYQVYLKFKSKDKKYDMGEVIVTQTNEHGVTYWKDNRNKHYFGTWGTPKISLTNIQYDKFKNSLRVFVKEKDERVYRNITAKELRPYMVECIKNSHMANYTNKHQEVFDVQYLKINMI